MFSELYNKYGFILLFGISVLIIIIFIIYNILSGNKGSYTDYGNVIWKLLFPSQNDIAQRQITESKGEAECRRVMEKLTGLPFPKQRPNFLRNNITNSNLELDCFNENLNIAVEYNGEQHYKYIPYFHKTKDAYFNTKYRDDIKRQLCKKYGVKLIIVPYTVPISEIENYLKTKISTLVK